MFKKFVESSRMTLKYFIDMQNIRKISQIFEKSRDFSNLQVVTKCFCNIQDYNIRFLECLRKFVNVPELDQNVVMKCSKNQVENKAFKKSVLKSSIHFKNVPEESMMNILYLFNQKISELDKSSKSFEINLEYSGLQNAQKQCRIFKLF